MKKMNNKGFSMVELIIVIAIMAILAGAVAPTLIKYVNKSRRSSDVSNAQTIASALQSALANDAANEAFLGYTSQTYAGTLSSLVNKTDSYASEVKAILGGGAPSVKYKKGFSGSGTCEFYVSVKSTTAGNDEVKVGVGQGSMEKELYPNVPADYE